MEAHLFHNEHRANSNKTALMKRLPKIVAMQPIIWTTSADQHIVSRTSIYHGQRNAGFPKNANLNVQDLSSLSMLSGTVEHCDSTKYSTWNINLILPEKGNLLHMHLYLCMVDQMYHAFLVYMIVYSVCNLRKDFYPSSCFKKTFSATLLKH